MAAVLCPKLFLHSQAEGSEGTNENRDEEACLSYDFEKTLAQMLQDADLRRLQRNRRRIWGDFAAMSPFFPLPSLPLRLVLSSTVQISKQAYNLLACVSMTTGAAVAMAATAVVGDLKQNPVPAGSAHHRRDTGGGHRLGIYSVPYGCRLWA